MLPFVTLVALNASRYCNLLGLSVLTLSRPRLSFNWGFRVPERIIPFEIFLKSW